MRILFFSTLVFGTKIRSARTVGAEVAEELDEALGRNAVKTTVHEQNYNADIYFFVYGFDDSGPKHGINGGYNFSSDLNETNGQIWEMKSNNNPSIKAVMNSTHIHFSQFEKNDRNEFWQPFLVGSFSENNQESSGWPEGMIVKANDDISQYGIIFAHQIDDYEDIKNIPFHLNIDVRYQAENPSNKQEHESLSGRYTLETLIYGSPSYVKSNSTENEPAIYFWTTWPGQHGLTKWAFTTFSSFQAELPNGYLSLETENETFDPLFLPSTGWTDNNGTHVEVDILLDSDPPNADFAARE